jgi:hypothetical protein
MLAVLAAAVVLGAIAVAIYSIVAPIRVSRAGDVIVIDNAGPTVRGARLTVTIGGRQLQVARDLPGGRTEIPLAAFDAAGITPGAGFEGASVVGSRWAARGWTWYVSGPVTTTAADPARDAPIVPPTGR